MSGHFDRRESLSGGGLVCVCVRVCVCVWCACVCVYVCVYMYARTTQYLPNLQEAPYPKEAYTTTLPHYVWWFCVCNVDMFNTRKLGTHPNRLRMRGTGVLCSDSQY